VLLLLVFRYRDRPSLPGAVALGLVCGLLASTRSEQVLLFPFVVLPAILGRSQLPPARRWAWVFISGATLLAVVAPWTIYNRTRFDHPVILSLGSGNAASVANCPAGYYGPHTGWYSLQCPRPLGIEDESDADAQERQAALTYARHHLARLPVVLVAREGRAFGFWDPFQQTALDAGWSQTPLWATRLGLWSFWALLVPAAGGVVVLRRRRVAVYPLLAPFAIVALAVAVAFGETRYRAPSELCLVVLAGVGLDAAWRRWGPSHPRPDPPPDPPAPALDQPPDEAPEPRVDVPVG
jgi:4-amino-4-deoxy-L-arabinose transferase-like glycosyltransferase